MKSVGFHVKSATKDQQLPGMVKPMFSKIEGISKFLTVPHSQLNFFYPGVSYLCFVFIFNNWLHFSWILNYFVE